MSRVPMHGEAQSAEPCLHLDVPQCGRGHTGEVLSTAALAHVKPLRSVTELLLEARSI
jgi:hypothetical protein